jgi:hypothetical protein
MNFVGKISSAFLLSFCASFQMSSATVVAINRASHERQAYNWEEYIGYYEASAKIEGFEGLSMITIAPRFLKGDARNYKELLVSNVKRINVGGRVSAQAEEYEFQVATLEKDDSVVLTFTTKEVGGIAYKFRGKYVAVKIHETSDYAIEGTLRKYSEGKIISKAMLTFNHANILE